MDKQKLKVARLSQHHRRFAVRPKASAILNHIPPVSFRAWYYICPSARCHQKQRASLCALPDTWPATHRASLKYTLLGFSCSHHFVGTLILFVRIPNDKVRRLLTTTAFIACTSAGIIIRSNRCNKWRLFHKILEFETCLYEHDYTGLARPTQRQHPRHRQSTHSDNWLWPKMGDRSS